MAEPRKYRSRLAESAYISPYSHSGAPGPHPNTDPYAPLRESALTTLNAMGYDPETMVERGVLWAEDQDPYGHVMHSQFMSYLGSCFYRVMESYAEFLDEEEYEGMVQGKTTVPAVRKYELDIRRQVKYPDTVGFRKFFRPIEYMLMWGSSLQRIGKTRSSLHATMAQPLFSR